MKLYDYDYVIYVGRFEPPHRGHMATVNKALRLGQRVIVLLGTPNSPRTPKNPFTPKSLDYFLLAFSLYSATVGKRNAI